MSGKTVIRLLLVLTILVSTLIRPPGTMLVVEGDTLTYEICAGGKVETIKVALGDESPKEIDLGCDFFTAQIGALSLHSVSTTPTEAEAFSLVALDRADMFVGQTHQTFNSPRAPPVLS